MEKEMLSKDDIKVFLENLDNNLSENITLYLIGGGAMSLKGLKAATVDVDLVVKTKKEFEALKTGLLKIGFEIDEEVHNKNIYKQAVMVFMKGISRVDVFIKSIVGMLDFTEAMEERATQYKEYSNLTIKLSSNEDVFLLKSLSDREKDIPDNRILIDTGLNWDVILKECVEQHRQDTKWIFWLFEQICRIENKYSISIPAKPRIFNICKDNWDKKPSDFMIEFDDETKYVPSSERKKIIKSKKK